MTKAWLLDSSQAHVFRGVSLSVSACDKHQRAASSPPILCQLESTVLAPVTARPLESSYWGREELGHTVGALACRLVPNKPQSCRVFPAHVTQMLSAISTKCLDLRATADQSNDA